jgi:Na+/H+-translocating membrane pyrophosphatase
VCPCTLTIAAHTGPSLNILIKLTSIVALVMAPLFSPDFSKNNFWIGIVVAVVSVVLIVVWQKYLDRTDPRIDFTSLAVGEKSA